MDIIKDDEEDNYITSEINVKERDLNWNIKIINSFEQCKRENEWVEGSDNEAEIKKCKIKINDELFHLITFINLIKLENIK